MKSIFIAIIIIGIFAPSIKAESYCFEEAGQKYGVSPALLYAISKVESGHNPQSVNQNSNGSTDRGHMQINSFWKPKLGNVWNQLFDPCVCTYVGAWVLSDCVRRYGYTWDAVACYHMGRSAQEMNPKNAAHAIQYVNRVYGALP